MLVCDIQSIETLDSKREEKIADINAERSTMLAGIQASGSLAALSIAGQLHQPGKWLCFNNVCYVTSI